MITKKLKNLFVLFFFFCCSSAWCDTWSDPTTLSNPSFSANVTGIPPIGVDASGNALTIWVSQESSQSVVRASYYDATTKTWSSPEQIGADGANDAHLAVSASGKAVAVWTNGTTSPSVHANIFDGSAWLGEVAVDSSSDYQTQFYPRVVIDNFERSHLIWQVQGGNLARVIRATTYFFDTNSWTQATNISTDYGMGNQFVALPALAINQAGAAYAMWIYQDTTTPLHKVQANRYSGGTWLSAGDEETIVTSSANTTQFAAPAIAVAPNGDALSLFLEYDATMSPIQDYKVFSSKFSTATVTWSTALQVSSQGIADVSKVFTDVCCDGSGDAIGIWQMKDETTPPGTSSLQASTFANLNWSSTVSTISDTALLQYIGRIAVDSLGDAYATWTASDNSTFMNIQAAKYTKSANSWSDPITISDDGLFTTGPDQLSGIAANDTGDFFAVWSHVDPSTSNVLMQASNVSVSPAPPTNFIGTVSNYNFLHTNQYVLESAWIPSTSSNIISYRLYNNDALFDEVSAQDPLLYVKIACAADAFNNYSVAAVSSNNVESARVSLTIVQN